MRVRSYDDCYYDTAQGQQDLTLSLLRLANNARRKKSKQWRIFGHRFTCLDFCSCSWHCFQLCFLCTEVHGFRRPKVHLIIIASCLLSKLPYYISTWINSHARNPRGAILVEVDVDIVLSSGKMDYVTMRTLRDGKAGDNHRGLWVSCFTCQREMNACHKSVKK